jgi:hypothetical protein
LQRELQPVPGGLNLPGSGGWLVTKHEGAGSMVADEGFFSDNQGKGSEGRQARRAEYGSSGVRFSVAEGVEGDVRAASGVEEG